MTQALAQIGPTPLVALLHREFERENLTRNLTLPEGLAQSWFEDALSGPIAELATRGGKEFRGELVSIAWHAAGGRGEPPPELPTIVEALHLGSLIVDDIEDDSPRRRGGPSLHQSAGLPLALNAGNWLYFWPSELILRLDLPTHTELALRRAVDRAVLNCHYGQALDLSVRITELRQREVPGVVLTTTRLKTGSLMGLAARVGAIAAGANPMLVEALGELGVEFGIALQMLDDLTGITEQRRCHKGHEDLLAARPTWAWAWLAESADSVAYCRWRALGESVVARDQHPEALAEQFREALGTYGPRAIRERVMGAMATPHCNAPGVRYALQSFIQRLLNFHG